ncbi:transposase, partial [Burkholderia thailandensis]|uniref:transposase n=1 Tax=Burkholderia thailandensis TaxID=57975 RepID=UPI00217D6539
QFRVQVQALARFNRHFFLAFAWHKVAPWPSVYASHTNIRIGSWGTKYPPIAALWRRAWDQVIPFYAFAPDIRKIVYTTNAIESLHMQLRKIIKARGHFPSDEAALKLIWLALRNVVAKWTGSRHDWKSAMTQFALLYPERFNIGV